MSQDSWRGMITQPQTVARYAYVINSPTTMIDHLGNEPYRPSQYTNSKPGKVKGGPPPKTAPATPEPIAGQMKPTAPGSPTCKTNQPCSQLDLMVDWHLVNSFWSRISAIKQNPLIVIGGGLAILLALLEVALVALAAFLIVAAIVYAIQQLIAWIRDISRDIPIHDKPIPTPGPSPVPAPSGGGGQPPKIPGPPAPVLPGDPEDDGGDIPNKGDLKRVNDKDFERVMDETAHAFKDDLMGKGSNSRFDIYQNGKWIYLVEKSTGRVIPTYTHWLG